MAPVEEKHRMFARAVAGEKLLEELLQERLRLPPPPEDETLLPRIRIHLARAKRDDQWTPDEVRRALDAR